jgi:uncharacterized protein YyaL (SSP411 family)
LRDDGVAARPKRGHGERPMQPLPGTEGHPAELQSRLAAAFALRPDQPPRTRHVAGDGRPLYTNRLALESSPYLLQHAHNPVDWHAWGDEAFAEARRLGRPVFLSIGYSTCHWCHVMEEESFEDETIAGFLNAHYVSIKVDREERPDVDAVYMRAAQQLTGSGGWPLSVWLTAEREPFFVGTYFPPYAGRRGAGHGFLDLLNELARLFDDDPKRVHEAAQALSGAVRADMEVAGDATSADGTVPSVRPDLALVAAAVEQCTRAYDDDHGGLRVGQKFPSHVPIRLLLRHHGRTGDSRTLQMAVHTLEHMAAGGIYDHVAGGFHRYATDPMWRVPHFEKMLYDNALLVVAYAEAWQVTKQPLFSRVVRETCDELLATFASPEGGFYSATDADSEGEEGKYFVWSEDEVRSVLGPGDATELFLRHYGVAKAGNSEGGNILYQPRPDENITQRLAPALAKLADVRKRRVPPLRDEKILAAWNGLAISAMAVAARVTAEPRYLKAAVRAADFLCLHMRDAKTGRLARSFRNGRLGTVGFLDDYAFAAAGLLDLFESTGDPRWFDEAGRLIEETMDLFADPDQGGWFMTSQEHERLLARERPHFDGAEPAGSSVALMNVARMAAFTDDERWRHAIDRGFAFYLPLMRERPMAMTEALLAVDFGAGPVREIVLAVPDREAPGELPMRRILAETFCPRKALVTGRPNAWSRLEERIPWLKDKIAHNGQPTAYVCTQGQCRLPTTDPTEFEQQLG